MNTNTTDPVRAIQLDLDDGKYRVLYDGDGGLRALRYGEPWRELTGDNLVFSLVYRVVELESALAQQPEAPAQEAVAEPAGYFDPDVLAHLADGSIDPVGILRRKPNGRSNVPVWLSPQPAIPEGVVQQCLVAFDNITDLCRHLRQGGPAPEDLHGLSDGLDEAVGIAGEMLAMLAAAQPSREVE